MISFLKKKQTRIFLVLIFSLAFGVVQEKIKLGLNNTIKRAELTKDYNTLSKEERETKSENLSLKELPSYFSNQNGIGFFYHFELSDLKKLKWALALVFIFCFFMLNATLLFLAFESKFLLKILLTAYLVLGFVSFSFYFVGSWINLTDAGYGVGRKILGALQSLVPTMILFPGFLIHQNSIKTIDDK